ncbi:MAG: amidohydrolase [Peptoniphilaceae bacterium]|nr:amidohydrolase [Peptoniphilaceae bacterium]MDY3738513.1 amidohydrolase [Peptoniphilaceae bacterium]
MDFEKIVEENKEYVKNLRREFHMHPELSAHEVNTTKRIAKELEKFGIDYEIAPEWNSGILATISTNPNGKRVMLRADIDGLNVKEMNDFDFKSQNEGAMHACGHDGHIAILLGAAKILSEHKDLINGTVYLVFQPAEEIGEGAKYMIRFKDWYEKVDNVFGGHVWGELDAGKISVEEGPRMAAGDKFTIDVIGKSGHGAKPDESIDATVVASAIVMNLQTLVSRKYSPYDDLVVTVGELKSGNRFNIISGSAHMEGTVRYFSKKIGDTIEERMNEVIVNTAKAFGADAKLKYEKIVPPTINESKSSKLAEDTVKETLGEEHLTKYTRTTGGEDFAYYMQNKPGCFAFVGIKNENKFKQYPHHNERFNMDDDVLSAASLVYAKYAINFLNSDI